MKEHLLPKTYWEERSALTEEALFRLVKLIAMNSPPMLADDISSTVREWDRLIAEIGTKYPAPVKLDPAKCDLPFSTDPS